MGLVPLHKYYVIEVEEDKGVTKSGIVLASQGKPTAVARVLAVPFDIYEETKQPPYVGNRIAISKYAPLEMELDGERVSIIDYDDIYGVLTNSFTTTSTEF